MIEDKAMKTIIIPKRFGFPTVDITINGKEQTFASGVEIRVENAVAEAIDNAIALYPKASRYKSRFAQYAEGKITELTASDLEDVEEIGFFAFAYSKKLKYVEIPSGVKSIGEGAFYGCSILESVMFGASSKIESIGSAAFNFCKLSSVFLPETPPTLVNIDAFANAKPACTFYCKTQESLDAYKAAPNWSTLTSTYSFVVENKNG